MYDPQLHLFLNDDEIVVRDRLYRMTQPLRKETAEPVLAANGEDEGTAIGYATAVYHPDARQFGLWYMAHQDCRIRHAVSDDARNWTRHGIVIADPEFQCDNLALAATGKRLAPWFADANLVGYAFRTLVEEYGLHAMKCVDGMHLEIKSPRIIAGAGDRSSLFYDDVLDEYWLISRRGRLGLPGLPAEEFTRPRVANLWKSTNLLEWHDHGVVLRYDDRDDPDVQIYGMQPFRWGAGYLAFVEIFHENIQRLETQLAYSADGLTWRRTDDRQTILPRGGEGAWDAYWTVPTFNPPIPWGDRLLVLYTGAGTMHGSGPRHRRGIGLASIRRDGWVSLDAGRTEGRLVTIALPLEKPMVLEVNANVYSGYLAVDVLPAVPGQDQQPVPGYESEKSRIEQVDSVCHRVAWGEQTVVEPIVGGRCHLRMRVYAGSLFSYRWREA